MALRVRMLVPMSGVGFDFNTGQVLPDDWNEADKVRLVERGLAEIVREEKTERAVKPAAEKAAK